MFEDIDARMTKDTLNGYNRMMQRTLIATMLMLLICTAGAAYFNYGFFHPDEYFQIIEFASNKLGITEAKDLPWEYSERVRPWLQPAICYVLIKGMVAVGIENRFVMTFVLRLIFGLIGCAAVGATTKLAMRWASNKSQCTFQALVIPILCYFPLLLTRTSSESFSLSLFTLAVALLMWRGMPAQRDGCKVGINNAIFVGMLLGLAFEIRYQTAALTLGLIAWMLSISRTRLWTILAVIAGMVLPIVASVFIDNWGYGEATFPFFNYFMHNMVMNKAAHYGTSPFYAYLYLVMVNPAPIFGLLLLLSMFLFWYRQPRHVWTWVTMPFFVIHSIISHKEDRFLLPMLVIMTAMLVPALDPSEGKPIALLKKMIRIQHRWVFWSLYSLNGIFLLLLSFYPFTVDSHFFLQRYIYENNNAGFEYYKTDFDPYIRWGLNYSFYKPDGLIAKKVSTVSEIERMPELSGSKAYFISGLPYIEGSSDELAHRTKRIVTDCALICFNKEIEEKLHPLLKALRDLSPENIVWGSIFEISPKEDPRGVPLSPSK
jgi:4-amino-4-deoxy-L-arabinose transferase and related glycosyltransferases of PMT family